MKTLTHAGSKEVTLSLDCFSLILVWMMTLGLMTGFWYLFPLEPLSVRLQFDLMIGWAFALFFALLECQTTDSKDWYRMLKYFCFLSPLMFMFIGVSLCRWVS